MTNDDGHYICNGWDGTADCIKEGDLAQSQLDDIRTW